MAASEAFPAVIREVGFDFSWDEKKVWRLEIADEPMPVSDLAWHFTVPFLWNPPGIYNLTPQEVLNSPENYPRERERIFSADLQYPIDIMENKGRWVILDGLHRLLKAFLEGRSVVRVRKIPRECIPQILKQ